MAKTVIQRNVVSGKKWEILEYKHPPYNVDLSDTAPSIELNQEEKFIQALVEYPREERVEILMSRLPESQIKFIYQHVLTWIHVIERRLDIDSQSISARFRTLAKRWHEETNYLSSSSEITNNDSYLEIISLGKAVIPYILRDLRERGGQWYRALRIISGENPVPTKSSGNVNKMKEAWFKWGRDNGYIE